MSDTITFPSPLAVTEAVRRLAEADPDRTEACAYVGANGPECIVGCALIQLGVPAEWFHGQLTGFQGTRNDENISKLADVELGWGYAGPDSDLVAWLFTVQDAQDRGKTWGNAVRIADGLEDDYDDDDDDTDG
jgi:hypothetical protein